MPDPRLCAGLTRERVDRARGLFDKAGVDALVVSRLENVRYLSGFTGSSASLLLTGSGALLTTDSRYAEQAAGEAPEYQVLISPGPPAFQAAREAGACRVGFEADSVPYDAWERMQAEVRDKAGGVLVPCRGLVEGLRVRKSPRELETIVRAVEIASEAFESVLPVVKPGIAERDLALEIEFRMKQAGAEEVAFELIVASGPRSSLPHGRASVKKVGKDEFVVFDIGARFEGYHSDMTRTVFTGRPGPKEIEIYRAVAEAQRLGVEKVAPGVAASDVDRAARAAIEEAGYGDRFGHGTGHGVGLQVHEAPRVGPRSDEVLEAGMVLTVEPGIYIPGQGGVRIEDIVAVTQEGRDVLTPTPKDAWILE